MWKYWQPVHESVIWYLVRDQYIVCPVFNTTMTLEVMSIESADDIELGEVMTSEKDRDLNTWLLRSQKYRHETQ